MSRRIRSSASAQAKLDAEAIVLQPQVSVALTEHPMTEPAVPEAVAILTTSAKAAIAPAVKAAVSGLAPTLAKNISKITKSAYEKLLVNIGAGLEEYLNASYHKSRFFKSILNSQQPLEVIDNYVHVTLSRGTDKLGDDDFLDQVVEKKHVVVTGLAGSGKSMLMKYATLLRFESPRGIVPLFVELRHLNPLTDRNLLTFIRLSCVSRSSELTQSQFELALKSGAFLLILDGFDEINYEYRESIQRQILDFEKDFPNCSILISSRPDERFGAWASYHVYQVDALTKEQCGKLISMLPYDAGVKKRFLREVNARLYSSHQSFLASPLLTTIMLLTYESFAEIPDKMHSFYGQAFDTLFQKHDAQKEQFQRKTHTGLTLEDFRACFAAFCAMSYLEENFSFKESELAKTASSAVNYLKSSQVGRDLAPTGDQFIEDLKSSVCMLQQDGVEIAFVHRSFQEYFAALFVVNLHSSKIRKVIDRYAYRFSDSAIQMALDMSRELVEQEWVLPVVDELIAYLAKTAGENAANRLARMFPIVHFNRTPKRFELTGFSIVHGPISQFDAVARLYPSRMGSNFVNGTVLVFPVEQFAELLEHALRSRPKAGMKKLVEWAQNGKGGITLPTKDLGQLLESTDLDKEIDSAVSKLKQVRADIGGRERKKANILDEFL